eukprot:TRINITY_DN17408_c0_g2_i4.p1 TRINITY_DN17408_c0_g2~~TRINITY_DN17408_c0_g2_i4.p1  ORF type:complete len:180 (-),score=31.86 TRINITY_DN17408_c0_g2_i4:346-885(-)
MCDGRCGVTPQSVLRFMGPFAPGLVRMMIDRRMKRFTEEQAGNLHDLEALSWYLYQNWCRSASGEYALNGVLQPGGADGQEWASARLPLEDRLVPGSVPCPLTFIYGDPSVDWMDSNKGGRIVGRLREAGHAANLMQVDGAGHQLFIEEPAEFNRLLIQALNQPINQKVTLGHPQIVVS